MTKRLSQYKIEQVDKALRRAHETMHKALDPKDSRVTAAILSDMAKDFRAISVGLDELAVSPFFAVEPEPHRTLKEPVAS